MPPKQVGKPDMPHNNSFGRYTQPAPTWLTPAGVVALLALVGALISIGWNYKSLNYAEEQLKTVKTELAQLAVKQERVIVLEVKLDTAIRTLDKISLQLEEQRARQHPEHPGR